MRLFFQQPAGRKRDRNWDPGEQGINDNVKETVFSVLGMMTALVGIKMVDNLMYLANKSSKPWVNNEVNET